MSEPRVLGLDDEAAWREALPADESAFGSVEFARIRSLHAGADPRLFVLDGPGGAIAHPLHLRSTAELGLGSAAERLHDAATPPFSGPRFPSEPDAATARAFQDGLAAWCASAGVVTEFDHLHPWRARTGLLDDSGVELDREIVYVDLTLDDEQMWHSSYTHACRKNVNRARREGVRVYAAEGEEGARELHRIYEITMERRGALPEYRFGPEYFAAFGELMPANACIVLAEHSGQVVAATLYLHDADDVYSYLGGADGAAQGVRPTNAIVDEIIRWGRAEGKRRLVLGGGYGPDDGILRFKASFSPLRAQFRVYRHVHMRAEYDALCDAWRERHGAETDPGGFFPPYRAAAQPD
jgi:hypothetical protein